MWEALIAKANIVIPQAVDAALRLTGVRLFGKLLEVPEAWADHTIAKIRDRTEARSVISRAMAEAAASQATSHPELISAYLDLMTSDFDRKLKNKMAVFRFAVEHSTVDSDTVESTEPREPSQDWLNSFSRFSEDADSEKLRELLGKILSGEIRSPGTFSLSTLRVVSELEQSTADDFSIVYAESIDSKHIYRDTKYARSPWWDRINRLRDAGFVSAAEGAIHQPPARPNALSFWSIGDGPTIVIQFIEAGRSEVSVFTLTKMGIEVGKLLPTPDRAANLHHMVSHNPFKAGWKRVELYEADSDGSATVIFNVDDTASV